MHTAPTPIPVRCPPPSVAPPRIEPPGPADHVDALILRVGQGDEHAFEHLYRQTSHRIYGLVRKIVIDVELSAETTQDVFLTLWQGAAARFDPSRGTGISWLLTLAHRRAIDKVRSEESHRTRTLRWGIKNQDVDYDQVADTVIHRLEASAVHSSLACLSVVQREAIHLAYFGGMTYAEVAGHLGIPVPTAKTRIRDGIRRLRDSVLDAA
jgi:RNA polymerase sigma-70 factor (ECF subfamily)